MFYDNAGTSLRSLPAYILAWCRGPRIGRGADCGAVSIDVIPGSNWLGQFHVRTTGSIESTNLFRDPNRLRSEKAFAVTDNWEAQNGRKKSLTGWVFNTRSAHPF